MKRSFKTYELDIVRSSKEIIKKSNANIPIGIKVLEDTFGGFGLGETYLFECEWPSLRTLLFSQIAASACDTKLSINAVPVAFLTQGFSALSVMQHVLIQKFCFDFRMLELNRLKNGDWDDFKFDTKERISNVFNKSSLLGFFLVEDNFTINTLRDCFRYHADLLDPPKFFVVSDLSSIRSRSNEESMIELNALSKELNVAIVIGCTHDTNYLSSVAMNHVKVKQSAKLQDANSYFYNFDAVRNLSGRPQVTTSLLNMDTMTFQ